jgi:hypothetical protein
MITDQDITKLKTVFATKDDLEHLSTVYATKEDLERFATKEDLKNLATKKDLEQYATKDELDELRIDMNDGFYVLNEKMDGLISAVDFIAGKYREREQEE